MAKGDVADTTRDRYGAGTGNTLRKCQCDASLRKRKRKICERGGEQP